MLKKEARAQHLQLREQVKRPDVERKSEQIAHRFLKQFGTRLAAPGTLLHVFLCMPTRKEINTNYLIEAARTQLPQLQLATSYITNFDQAQMQTTRLQPESDLIGNHWGVPEPIEIWPVEATAVDVLVVPLLAYDTQGYRVGYGKGFYDRFLATCRPDALRVGVSLFAPTPPLEDLHANDLPLHHCVTPDRVYNFAPPQGGS